MEKGLGFFLLFRTKGLGRRSKGLRLGVYGSGCRV
jgi:hypothetical protein